MLKNKWLVILPLALIVGVLIGLYLTRSTRKFISDLEVNTTETNQMIERIDAECFNHDQTVEKYTVCFDQKFVFQKGESQYFIMQATTAVLKSYQKALNFFKTPEEKSILKLNLCKHILDINEKALDSIEKTKNQEQLKTLSSDSKEMMNVVEKNQLKAKQFISELDASKYTKEQIEDYKLVKEKYDSLDGRYKKLLE